MKRKENQIRELQQRLENSEGCKSNFHFSFRKQLVRQVLIYILRIIFW